MRILIFGIDGVPAILVEARTSVAVEAAAVPGDVVAAHDVKDMAVVVVNLVEVHVLEGHVLGVEHGNLQPTVVVRAYDTLGVD